MSQNNPQTWTVTLTVTQECDENMSEAELRVWLKEILAYVDYGIVKISEVHQISGEIEHK